jgi:hypothetical protein
MKIRALTLAFAAIPIVAVAQVTPIGPFTGAMQDGYEAVPNGQFLPHYDIFGGAGDVDQFGGGQGVHITTGWSFFSTVFPHGGNLFLGGAACNYQFIFDTPAFQFGGYFATNADSPGAVATFYDDTNAQIGGPMAIGAPMGQWQWDGWEYAGGIKRIEVVANNQFGGFILSDDLEYNAVPEPAAFVAIATGLGLLLIRRKR